MRIKSVMKLLLSARALFVEPSLTSEDPLPVKVYESFPVGWFMGESEVKVPLPLESLEEP